MHYASHDQALLTWGVATETAGRLTVLAHQSRAAADAAAEKAPKITIIGAHPTMGVRMTVSDVSPLVYHHAEAGWTFAAVGWPISAHDPQ